MARRAASDRRNDALLDEIEQLRTALDASDEQMRRRTRELRASEASFRAVADLVPDMLWRTDRGGAITWRNRRWRDYVGDASDAVAFERGSLVHPADRPGAMSAWRLALSEGRTFQVEQRMRGESGAYRWFLARAEPVRNEHGDVTQWFGACTDIHDRRMATEALEATEQRLRTLVEGMPQLVWRARAGGRWTWASPQWRAFTGQSEEASLGMGWLNAIHPDDRDRFRQAWIDAGETDPVDIEARVFSVEEGRHRHFRTRATPVAIAGGHASEWLGTSTDVDDTATLQVEQRMLVAELQHRTRNLVAVVRAMLEKTARNSDGLQSFAETFGARLAALARVQELLSRLGEHDRVHFDELLRAELSAHGASDSPAVTLSGPEGVPLRSGAVQTLALALHELATNAVKYGALRQPEAHLDIRWTVEPAPRGSRRLKIDWSETGVRMPDTAPGPGGQGRELIERVLPYQLDARTSYVLGDDGVTATIDVPVSSRPRIDAGPREASAAPL